MFMDRKKQLLVAEHIAAVLKPFNYDCLDVEWAPHSRTLCVFVDRSDGIQIEHCVHVNSILVEDQLLDEIIACEFVLEVSSPGIERPLRTLEHFKSAFTSKHTIEVKLTEKYLSRMRGRGIIQAIDQDTVVLKTDEGMWSFPIEMVQKARQLMDWDSYSKNQLTDAVF